MFDIKSSLWCAFAGKKVGGAAFAVQFFFILSGFMVGKSIKDTNYGLKNAINLMWKRFFSVWPLYVLCYFFVFLERCIILHKQGYEWAVMLEHIPLNISELFMIQNLLGIVSINALSWYMSAWFVAGTVLSFGCWIVRNRLPRAELYFCFFIPIFWYAYCQKRELFFNTTESYMGIMYGICGMCLGLGAYRIQQMWKDFLKWHYIVVDVLKIILLLLAVILTFIWTSPFMRYVITAIETILCILMCTVESWIDKVVDKNWILFMGKMTFPIYLLQVMPMLLYQLEVIPLRIFSRIYVPMTILFSLIVVVILEFCKYIIRVVQKCL